mmetsp:Transcript_33267/g.73060  ORF Transcript_33267/g.73060 Transcript_33267/m.73060 type:complete len:93 (-) Transcript_33267:825-1103(-)
MAYRLLQERRSRAGVMVVLLGERRQRGQASECERHSLLQPAQKLWPQPASHAIGASIVCMQMAHSFPYWLPALYREANSLGVSTRSTSLSTY